MLRRSDVAHCAGARRAVGRGEQAGQIAADLNGRSVLSVYAPVPSLGWLVFVELPIDEAYAPIYASIARSASCCSRAARLRHPGGAAAQPPHDRSDPGADAGRGAHRQRRSRPAARDQDRRRARGAGRAVQPDGGAAAQILRDARSARWSSAPPSWRRRATRPGRARRGASARARPPSSRTRRSRASSRWSATSCARRSTA